MDVSSQPDVIGEVPSHVIGIIVNGDVVRIPEPAVCVSDIVRGNRKIKTVEPETVGTSAPKTPDMSTANAAIKTTMFICVIEPIMRVAAASIVAYPLSVGMDVGSLRVSLPVAEVAVLSGGMRISHVRRTASRNVLAAATDLGSATAVPFVMVLCHG